MKLLITGGGFVAKAIIRAYPKMDITVMSRTPKPGNWIKGDVVSFKFPKEPFTHIIHAPLLEAPFEKYESEGLRRVLEYGKSIDAPVLYCSSGAATGDTDYGPYKRQYGRYKRQAEELCKDAKIARLYAFIGPDLQWDRHYAIMNFIHEAMTTKHITVKGDGTNVRTWLWQGDMATRLIGILKVGSIGRFGWTYDVGSDEEHTILDAANMVAEETGSTLEVLGKPYGNQRYVPDTKKMYSREMGDRLPLREAIRRTIQCMA